MFIAEAQTPQQVREAVQNIRRSIESKSADKMDKIQAEQREDVQIFLRYCDNILEQGINDIQAFTTEMRRVWRILND